MHVSIIFSFKLLRKRKVKTMIRLCRLQYLTRNHIVIQRESFACKVLVSLSVDIIMIRVSASVQQNLQLDLCDQRRLKSACASAQSDQSLRLPHVPSTASLLYRVGEQADPSLCWSQRSYFRFCRAMAQFFIFSCLYDLIHLVHICQF